MQTQKNQFRKTIFPKKSEIFKAPPKGSQKIKVFSNHFPVELKSCFKNINEWYMKIFSRKNEEGEDQGEIYLKNPAVIKNEIAPDARK